MAQMKATGAAVQVATWKDHHDYRDEDVAWLAHAARRADHVVITQKDAVKLRDRWPAAVPEPLVAVLDLSGRTAAIASPPRWTPSSRPWNGCNSPSEPTRTSSMSTTAVPSTRPHPSRQGHAFLTEENPFEAMMSRFDYAAQRLSLDPGALQGAASPGEADHRRGAGRPRQRGGGGVHRVSRAVQHLRGPAKGGIRFDTER